MAKKKTKRKKSGSNQSKKVKAKPVASSKAKKKKKAAAKSKSKPARRRVRGRANAAEFVSYEQRGMGARSGGQSGDTQGVSAGPDVDSESVEELLEEGQSYEAEVINGVENAPDPDQGEVRTRQVKEDDVPEEYREQD
jgi:hypothetical protein